MAQPSLERTAFISTPSVRQTHLLVDDEPNIAELGKVYLGREGFRTMAVGNGLLAIEAGTAQTTPSIIGMNDLPC